MLSWHQLAGIQDIVRIHGRLNGPHQRNRLFPEFELQEFLFAQPDTMLAGAGATHTDCPLHHSLTQLLYQFIFCRNIRIDKKDIVKVSVADMSKQKRCYVGTSLDIVAGLADAVRQTRNRHTDIGCI